MGLNTYLGRLELPFRRLEPSWRRLEAPWIRLRAGKNSDLAKYALLKIKCATYMLQQHLLKAVCVDWNTYLGRLESYLPRLEPS